jgi:hypothetical protein
VASVFYSAAPANAQQTKLEVFAGVQNLPLMAVRAQGGFAKRGLTIDMKIAHCMGRQLAPSG